MKRLTMLLFLAVFMFLLTTTIVVLIPVSIPGPFDWTEKLFLGSILLMGYAGSGIYYSVYRAEKKESITKPQKF